MFDGDGGRARAKVEGGDSSCNLVCNRRAKVSLMSQMHFVIYFCNWGCARALIRHTTSTENILTLFLRQSSVGVYSPRIHILKCTIFQIKNHRNGIKATRPPPLPCKGHDPSSPPKASQGSSRYVRTIGSIMNRSLTSPCLQVESVYLVDQASK